MVDLYLYMEIILKTDMTELSMNRLTQNSVVNQKTKEFV